MKSFEQKSCFVHCGVHHGKIQDCVYLIGMEMVTISTLIDVQRINYNTLVDQLIVQPGTAAPKDDHPLSESSDSEWGAFFQDNQILAQIDKDVRRLCPEIQFFQTRTKYPHRSAAEINLSVRVTGSDLISHDYEIDKFGVANGMNEVLGPIYYVLASDPDSEWAEFAEADSFYCFQQLMSEIKDNFIKTLDDSTCGIESTMSSFHALLASFDPTLHDHLVGRLAIRPQFYAFRWLSLLLSQEFSLPDVINLWDSFFADPMRFSLLPYVCLAMLERRREELLEGDFADCLRLLQNYSETDIVQLVLLAQDIRDGRACRPNEDIPAKQGSIAKTARQLSKRLRGLTILKK
uniref:Rab-GAP TBC domain-containing protein n=1 Tax=Heterorhabditis bacteriophora TaxID=37862 RepID=A0A1I7X4C9_HETBA